jgi:hypothetical protein
MINPLSVLVCTPSLDGKVECGYAGGLASAGAEHLFGNMAFLNSCSHIAHARNQMVAGFLQSQFDQLVFIDSDIGFSAQDFKFLMNYPQVKGQAAPLPPDQDEFDGAATKDASGEAMISCAEYSRKTEAHEAVRLGLGFCKISREVFTRLDALRETSLDGPESVGGPVIDQYMSNGSLISDYFISGSRNGRWLGEDQGFFILCHMAGIVPRIEQRTNLIHIGRKAYQYNQPVISG